jgi:hypothetical protein
LLNIRLKHGSIIFRNYLHHAIPFDIGPFPNSKALALQGEVEKRIKPVKISRLISDNIKKSRKPNKQNKLRGP